MKRTLVVGALLFAWLLPCAAAAQGEVMVLGIRSVEGDDEFTRNLTGALRHAASQVEGWRVSQNEVTLAQMALAHGCDEPDPTCLAAIANSLNAGRIIYGDVRRTSAGENFDFAVSLHNFNADSDQIEHSLADTIPGIRRDIDDLREPARRWMAALSGAPRTGTLSISVNVPGAEIFIDGRSAGTANDAGALEIAEVEPGTRNVRIVAIGHQTFQSTVAIEPYTAATFEAELEQGGGGDDFPVDLVVGVSMLIVAAGLAAGWIGSWARIQSINSSEQWAEIRNRYSTNIDNLCAQPGREDVAPLCDEASTLEVLQFVFGVGAAAVGGVGLYFLIQSMTGQAPEEQAVQLVPSVGLDHAYLGARVRF